MANLFFGAVTSSGTVQKDGPTISDADMTRFTDWVWGAYPQFEPDGTTLKPKTDANIAQSVKDWGDALWRGTKANVLRHERLEAARTASDAIDDLG